MNQTFTGWVLRQALGKDADARAVAGWIKRRSWSYRRIREAVAKALQRGVISGTEYSRLMGALEDLLERYRKGGKLIDLRDSKDWMQLGHGARMRKVHLFEDGARA